jgi:hypothetical protein
MVIWTAQEVNSAKACEAHEAGFAPESATDRAD